MDRHINVIAALCRFIYFPHALIGVGAGGPILSPSDKQNMDPGCHIIEGVPHTFYTVMDP